jgi:hypothetical protein
LLPLKKAEQNRQDLNSEYLELLKKIFQISTIHLSINPKDFYHLTMIEYRLMYIEKFGEQEKPLSRNEFEDLIDKFEKKVK